MNRKGFGLIEIIIAVAIIALLAGGGLYIKNLQNQQLTIQAGLDTENKAQQVVQQVANQTNQEQNALNQIGATTTVSIDTSNWKTYRNNRYGFEFKYPATVNYPSKDDPDYSAISERILLHPEVLTITPQLANLTPGIDLIGDKNFNTNKVGFMGISIDVTDHSEDLDALTKSFNGPHGPYRFITVNGKQALQFTYGGENEGEEAVIPVATSTLYIVNSWYFLDSPTFTKLIQSIKLSAPLN